MSDRLKPPINYNSPTLPFHTKVTTPDGEGEIVSYNFRKNTNGGPGTRQYIVKLCDGRTRRYTKNEVMVM